MALRRLQVTDFRCLQSAELSLDSRFTLISGPNASGKTSVLEAIYVLGRGRSFRTRLPSNLIRTGAREFVVFGEVDGAGTDARRVGVGLQGSSTGLRGRVGGANVSTLADLALALPVQIVDPEVHRLIEEGPAHRRRFMDWGVFHVEPTFIETWQRYQLGLKQRNAALKLRQPRAMVNAWDADLERWGEAISAARIAYVHNLGSELGPVVGNLLGREVELTYRRGWPKDLSLSEALRQSWTMDLERGVTHVGPQRADLQISIGGRLARGWISRGQQKLLAAALLIAQIRFFRAESPVRPTLLLDDPAAELDSERLIALVAEVCGMQSLQLVVTTLADNFPALGIPGHRYQIVAGILRAV